MKIQMFPIYSQIFRLTKNLIEIRKDKSFIRDKNERNNLLEIFYA